MSAFLAAAVLLPNAVRGQESLASYWRELESAASVSALQRVAPPTADPGERALADVMRRSREYDFHRDRTVSLLVIRDLERMLRDQPSAWVHFALGVALARGPDVREVLGDDPNAYVVWRQSNARSRAPRELRRALELDSTLHEAAYVLAEFALDTGDPTHVREAMAALTRGNRSREPRSLLLQSRLLLHQRKLPEAERAAVLADEHGANRAVAFHDQAVAMLLRPAREAEGARLYFEGLEILDEASTEAYFRPLYPVLTPGEMKRWSERPVSERADFIRRFWNVHAALSGVPLHERMAEHYRRLVVTREQGRSAPMGAGAALDDAGDVRSLGISGVSALMMLRHGDPDRVMRILFCGREVLDVPLPVAPSPQECARTPMGRLRGLMASETRLLRLQAQDLALPGSSYSPEFERYLTASWELLQFRGAAGQTLLVAALAVPGASARELVTDGTLRATVALALVDTAEASVERVESTRAFVAGAIRDDAWVLLNGVLPTSAAGARLVRLTVTNPGRTVGGMMRGEVVITPFHDDSLRLSDVVVAPLDGTPSFTRGAVGLSLAPGREFSSTEEAALYYEIYGLAERTPYRTEITLTPRAEGLADRIRSVLPGRPQSLRLAFDEVAGAPDEVMGLQQGREVGLGGIEPGVYDLRVTVTDQAGRQATRERVVWVVEDPLSH